MPLGSGAIAPQPKRGGKARPKLAVHEIQTKPKDTVLLVKRQALSWNFLGGFGVGIGVGDTF